MGWHRGVASLLCVTFSICVPTVDRPYRHGFFQRLVETKTLEHAAVRGFHLAVGRGPNDNAAHALRRAIDDATDYVIFLEDDIDIVDDFIPSVTRFMRDVVQGDRHFYPLGCAMRRAMRQSLQSGALTWAYPVREFYGACGLVFPRESARAFCDAYDQSPPWMMSWNGLDVNLRNWHQRISPATHLVTPVPCLIDHLGQTSSLSSDPSHYTGRYPGFLGRHGTYPRT